MVGEASCNLTEGESGWESPIFRAELGRRDLSPRRPISEGPPVEGEEGWSLLRVAVGGGEGPVVPVGEDTL